MNWIESLSCRPTVKHVKTVWHNMPMYGRLTPIPSTWVFYAKFQSFFGVQLGHTIPPLYCSIINHRYHKHHINNSIANGCHGGCGMVKWLVYLAATVAGPKFDSHSYLFLHLLYNLPSPHQRFQQKPTLPKASCINPPPLCSNCMRNDVMLVHRCWTSFRK